MSWPALGSAARLAAAPAAVAITVDNFAFSAPELDIATGTRVTWTNRDDTPHTITDASQPSAYASPALDSGDVFSRVFATPGTYRYFCSLHPFMRGSLTVR